MHKWLASAVKIVQEYVRRLGSLLLCLQANDQGPERAQLNTWVAEARALRCCIRSYNPEALKKLESSSLDPNAAVQQDLSTAFCAQELVSLTCSSSHHRRGTGLINRMKDFAGCGKAT